MTYLFFDIECANSFSGIGKICSFGYMLCDSDFSVIESDDILMNAKAPFDWYLFSKNARCKLAYPREEYQSHPDFTQHYERIKNLLEDKDRLVIGFGCQNDVATIACECIRYGLKLIDFDCHDVHNALEQFYETKGRLGEFVEKLGIDTEGLEFHDSKADAYFTMKVTEKLLKDSGKGIKEIFSPFRPFSSRELKKAKIKKLYMNYLERKDAAKQKNMGKPPRPPKKVTVPKDFDARRELLAELEIQARENR